MPKQMSTNQKMPSGYIEPQNSSKFYDSVLDILGDFEFTRKGKKGQLGNFPCVFDIESSSFYEGENKVCCMYAWVFGINGRCVRGRTWQEFLDVLNIVKRYYNISPSKRIIIYIHNLAYEFQWFHKYFEWEKVFSMDSRKPLYCITKDGLEFRCSYLLSGYSLEVLGSNLTKYKVSKKVGDLDYKLVRTPTTPLDEKEWGYILNDGLVVMAHIQEEIERLGSIKKLPLTKTGYVRALCREKCLQGSHRFDYVEKISTLTLTTEDYARLKRAYMGGFTHANAAYVGAIVENVHSYDFSSSYPAVMVSEKFPMSPPHKVVPKDSEDFLKYLKAFCCLFDVTFYNITSTSSFENYISVSKCVILEHYYANNGRVVDADILKITLTEQDFFIIAQMYEWDSMIVENFTYFYKDYLPRPLVNAILDLYVDKTSLKGVEEKIVEYLVSKGMINALYGMSVTDICRDDVIYDKGEWKVQEANYDELIAKYNTDKQRFLYYPWGVWVTAYARSNLFSGIIEFGDDYVYSDTDSIKVINKDAHEEYIKAYNKKVTEKVYNCLDYHKISRDRCCPKTIKGIPKPIGVWDYEGIYDRFKTLGAKRYITEQYQDLAITVAGVNKRAGAEYLKYTYKTMENIFNSFEEHMVFPSHYNCDGVDKNGSGKLLHTYIDYEMEGDVKDYMGNICHYKELSGVHLENTEYSLSLEKEFAKLIAGIREGHIVI